MKRAKVNFKSALVQILFGLVPIHKHGFAIRNGCFSLLQGIRVPRGRFNFLMAAGKLAPELLDKSRLFQGLINFAVAASMRYASTISRLSFSGNSASTRWNCSMVMVSGNEMGLRLNTTMRTSSTLLRPLGR